MSLLPVRKGLVFELEITIKLRNYGIICKHAGGKNDGGVDIRGRIYCMDFVVQCKLWRHQIGPNVIRELDGTLSQPENKGAIGVIVISSYGRFSDDAIRRAKASIHIIILTKEGRICRDLEIACQKAFFNFFINYVLIGFLFYIFLCFVSLHKFFMFKGTIKY
ncbi:restriction endonuclease [Gigaspora margarita]|uniref:Restriction endonuclease n=1 Tax=Gigaspora margarita TaxID=4874 RepID=A0A8H4EUK1_GIGMA|nr:restriction endonuclease [Gigaspora margarita]